MHSGLLAQVHSFVLISGRRAYSLSLQLWHPVSQPGQPAMLMLYTPSTNRQQGAPPSSTSACSYCAAEQPRPHLYHLGLLALGLQGSLLEQLCDGVAGSPLLSRQLGINVVSLLHGSAGTDGAESAGNRHDASGALVVSSRSPLVGSTQGALGKKDRSRWLAWRGWP